MTRLNLTPFRLLLAASALLLGALLTPSPGSASEHELNLSAGLTGQGAPLALRGYDPVGYFVDAGPRLGSAAHSTAHDGATYRFASAENLARFERSPQRFVPQYGGFCAYGVSVGAKFDGDPQVWEIVDGKLYLNLNAEIQKAWKADIDGAVRKADSNWPRIRSVAPAALKPAG
ncbi:MAG: YHS domain-containing (seleno)protein [Acidobacteriota bacterium]